MVEVFTFSRALERSQFNPCLCTYVVTVFSIVIFGESMDTVVSVMKFQNSLSPKVIALTTDKILRWL